MRLPKRLLLLGLGAAIAARHQFIPRYDLTGKSVLITGGSRGLGLALAREFAARGARLTLLARSGDDLERAAAGLREQGAAVTTFAGDVTQQDDLEGAIQQACASMGRWMWS
ncbi:SDR family NAD(P)-dependent oxidoreductase [Deinococcus radiophilus]|uniref:SDR family NAD(P)-dependent oxidoreductase n=1 Tax=Deinococcus radiophilus TaxID=32062 RepID=UPI003618B4CE